MIQAAFAFDTRQGGNFDGFHWLLLLGGELQGLLGRLAEGRGVAAETAQQVGGFAGIAVERDHGFAPGR